MTSARSLCRTALVLALLACLPAAGAQASPPQATFQAASVSWFTQTPDAAGEFVGLRSRLGTTDESPPIEDSLFEIQGARVKVERDTSELYAETPVTYYPGQVNQSTQAYTDAMIQGKASRIGRFLYVFPLDGGISKTTLSCAGASASQERTLKAESRIVEDKKISADSSQTLQVTPCPGSTLTIKGSFLAVLWEWDCHLIANEGEATLWSGKAQQDNAPDLRPYASRAQQLYITVHDGSFTIAGNAERPPILFMQSLSLSGASQVNLNNASGHVNLGDLPVQGHRIEASGNLDAALTRSSGGVAMRVEEGLTGLQVDGKPVALSATIALPSPSGAGFVVAMAALAIVVVLATVFVYRHPLRHYGKKAAESLPKTTYRQKRGIGYWGLAAKAFNAGRPRLAILYCSLSARLIPDSLEVPFLKALALGRLERHAEAKEIGLRIYDFMPEGESRAALACHVAHMLVKMGRRSEAVAWVKQAFEQDWHITKQETDHSSFDDLLGDTWFKTLRTKGVAAVAWDPNIG